MIQIILIISLITSFLVMAVMFYQKLPVLNKIAINNSSAKEDSYIFKIRKRILEIPFVKNFSWNSVLQKILSKIRVFILKIENKIGDFLHLLRKKSEKK